MKPLYTYNNKEIGEEDFIRALREVGVREGDMIFVHSSVAAFGKPHLENPQEFLSGLVQVLTDSVGEKGTLIMPTFTYSFGKGEIFDRRHSPSTVGSLTEFFRRQPGVVRSLHPMLSVALWGERVDLLDINKDTFGAGTIFDKLREHNAKIVFFGVSMAVCTFLHHVEQMHGVSYRFMKTFTGTVIDNDCSYEDSYTYYARKLEENIDTDMMRIEPLVRSKGLMSEARVGSGSITIIDAAPLFAAGMDYLDADPLGLTVRI